MTWDLCDTDWNHWPANESDATIWQKASELKLSGIELGVYRAAEQLTPARLDTLEELIASTGIPVSGLLLSLPPERWPRGALAGDAAGVATELECLAATARRFGVRVVGLWPGADLGGADRATLLRGLRLIDAVAADAGLKVAVEYKPDTAVTDAETTLSILDGLDHLGVLVDVGHAYALGEEPAEVVHSVAAAGKLWHLHLGDAQTGGADDDLPVGRLHDARPYLAALRDIDYAGAAAFDLYGAVAGGEMTCAAAVGESVAAVRAAMAMRANA